MRYTTVLFDLDHTLFDFDRSEAEALEGALTRAGVPWSDDVLAQFRSINIALWREVEAGDRTPDGVRVTRFTSLLASRGWDVDPVGIADDFIGGLGRCGGLYPGARRVLDQVGAHASLALVSNGIGEVARAKIARLGLAQHFDAVVISGEVGVAKPDRRFFDLAFGLLGHPAKAAVLLVGDSLTSDVRGGIEYGIDTCWYAPRGEAPADLAPTYRVRALEEIPPIVAGG